MDLPKQVLELFEKFNQANFQFFVVGGAVRDLLLKRPVKDWDFTTDATPEQILEILPEGYYNNQFGTVGLKTDIGILEITTMRKESGYSDSRHPEKVEWTNKIEEDLARRDFTINALALSLPVISSVSEKSLPPSEGRADLKQNLIDPYDGQSDLGGKLIRCVGDPNQRFQEDALRLIRAIRFSTQLEFKIEPKTFQAIKEKASLIQNISWERIRDELFKILECSNPYQGILDLKEHNLLKYILPELERCFGIQQEGPKHDRIYDIGGHSLLSLKHCPSEDPLVRFATLIHDIGKPDTHRIQADGNATFYGHDIVGGRIAQKVCERLRFSKKQTDKVVTLVKYHMFTVNEEQTDSAIRRFIKNIGLENIDDMMAVRIGDRLGGGTENAVSWRMKQLRERIDQVLIKPFSISDLKITGTDVMEILDLKPSPKVGEILQKLFAEVLADASKNNREYLVKQIKKTN